MNEEIFRFIFDKYHYEVNDNPDGQELNDLHTELSSLIHKKLGFDIGDQVDTLVNRTAVHHGWEMLKIGLTLGRNPHLVFDLPDSPHLKDGEFAGSELTNAILDAARTKADSSPAYEAWLAKCNELGDKLKTAPPEVRSLYWEVVWHGLMLRGESMFLLGWELRGNPDKLLVLPDAE